MNDDILLIIRYHITNKQLTLIQALSERNPQEHSKIHRQIKSEHRMMSPQHHVTSSQRVTVLTARIE